MTSRLDADGPQSQATDPAIASITRVKDVRAMIAHRPQLMSAPGERKIRVYRPNGLADLVEKLSVPVDCADRKVTSRENVLRCSYTTGNPACSRQLLEASR